MLLTLLDACQRSQFRQTPSVLRDRGGRGAGARGGGSWIGGATFDLPAGISHRGLHPTHHIAPDVDEERDTLTADLLRARQVRATFRVTGIGVRVDAHNAEGDRFDTDGEMRVVVMSPGNVATIAAPEPPVPIAVRAKDHVRSWFHRHSR